ncbi:N-acetylmuramoyl-L-alanine amidase [Niabella insulamsoli]|uniref:N-acetylmuramoyl-L-alanine amidase n=1 Tax=Niabella insulamsoli TaxID=3144874 RepID=UPI0031FBB74E
MAIFLSAGHHHNDPGAVSNGRKENQETVKLRDAILNFIKPEYKVFTDSDDETLSQYLNRIKPGSGSVVMELHFDASGTGKASGTTALHKDNAGVMSVKFCKSLTEAVARVLRINNRGAKSEKDSHRGRLAFVHEPGINGLLEICFIDSKEDMARYDANFLLLAKNIAAVLMTYDDLIR